MPAPAPLAPSSNPSFPQMQQVSAPPISNGAISIQQQPTLLNSNNNPTSKAVRKTFSQHWIVIQNGLRVLLLDFEGSFCLLIPGREDSDVFAKNYCDVEVQARLMPESGQKLAFVIFHFDQAPFRIAAPVLRDRRKGFDVLSKKSACVFPENLLNDIPKPNHMQTTPQVQQQQQQHHHQQYLPDQHQQYQPPPQVINPQHQGYQVHYNQDYIIHQEPQAQATPSLQVQQNQAAGGGLIQTNNSRVNLLQEHHPPAQPKICVSVAATARPQSMPTIGAASSSMPTIAAASPSMPAIAAASPSMPTIATASPSMPVISAAAAAAASPSSTSTCSSSQSSSVISPHPSQPMGTPPATIGHKSTNSDAPVAEGVLLAPPTAQPASAVIIPPTPLPEEAIFPKQLSKVYPALRDNEKNRLMQCRHCYKKFYFASEHLIHLRKHTPNDVVYNAEIERLTMWVHDRKLKCDRRCKKKIRSYTLDYAKHMDNHLLKLLCEICKCDVESPHDFAQHMEIHHQSVMFAEGKPPTPEPVPQQLQKDSDLEHARIIEEMAESESERQQQPPPQQKQMEAAEKPSEALHSKRPVTGTKTDVEEAAAAVSNSSADAASSFAQMQLQRPLPSRGSIDNRPDEVLLQGVNEISEALNSVEGEERIEDEGLDSVMSSIQDELEEEAMVQDKKKAKMIQERERLKQERIKRIKEKEDKERLDAEDAASRRKELVAEKERAEDRLKSERNREEKNAKEIAEQEKRGQEQKDAEKKRLKELEYQKEKEEQKRRKEELELLETKRKEVERKKREDEKVLEEEKQRKQIKQRDEEEKQKKVEEDKQKEKERVAIREKEIRERQRQQQEEREMYEKKKLELEEKENAIAAEEKEKRLSEREKPVLELATIEKEYDGGEDSSSDADKSDADFRLELSEEEEEEEEAAVEDEKHSCSICGDEFATANSLRIHRLRCKEKIREVSSSLPSLALSPPAAIVPSEGRSPTKSPFSLDTGQQPEPVNEFNCENCRQCFMSDKSFKMHRVMCAKKKITIPHPPSLTQSPKTPSTASSSTLLSVCHDALEKSDQALETPPSSKIETKLVLSKPVKSSVGNDQSTALFTSDSENDSGPEHSTASKKLSSDRRSSNSTNHSLFSNDGYVSTDDEYPPRRPSVDLRTLKKMQKEQEERERLAREDLANYDTMLFEGKRGGIKLRLKKQPNDDIDPKETLSSEQQSPVGGDKVFPENPNEFPPPIPKLKFNLSQIPRGRPRGRPRGSRGARGASARGSSRGRGGSNAISTSSSGVGSLTSSAAEIKSLKIKISLPTSKKKGQSPRGEMKTLPSPGSKLFPATPPPCIPSLSSPKRCDSSGSSSSSESGSDSSESSSDESNVKDDLKLSSSDEEKEPTVVHKKSQDNEVPPASKRLHSRSPPRLNFETTLKASKRNESSRQPEEKNESPQISQPSIGLNLGHLIKKHQNPNRSKIEENNFESLPSDNQRQIAPSECRDNFNLEEPKAVLNSSSQLPRIGVNMGKILRKNQLGQSDSESYSSPAATGPPDNPNNNLDSGLKMKRSPTETVDTPLPLQRKGSKGDSSKVSKRGVAHLTTNPVPLPSDKVSSVQPKNNSSFLNSKSFLMNHVFSKNPPPPIQKLNDPQTPPLTFPSRSSQDRIGFDMAHLKEKKYIQQSLNVFNTAAENKASSALAAVVATKRPGLVNIRCAPKAVVVPPPKPCNSDLPEPSTNPKIPKLIIKCGGVSGVAPPMKKEQQHHNVFEADDDFLKAMPPLIPIQHPVSMDCPPLISIGRLECMRKVLVINAETNSLPSPIREKNSKSFALQNRLRCLSTRVKIRPLKIKVLEREDETALIGADGCAVWMSTRDIEEVSQARKALSEELRKNRIVPPLKICIPSPTKSNSSWLSSSCSSSLNNSPNPHPETETAVGGERLSSLLKNFTAHFGGVGIPGSSGRRDEKSPDGSCEEEGGSNRVMKFRINNEPFLVNSKPATDSANSFVTDIKTAMSLVESAQVVDLVILPIIHEIVDTACLRAKRSENTAIDADGGPLSTATGATLITTREKEEKERFSLGKSFTGVLQASTEKVSDENENVSVTPIKNATMPEAEEEYMCIRIPESKKSKPAKRSGIGLSGTDYTKRKRKRKRVVDKLIIKRRSYLSQSSVSCSSTTELDTTTEAEDDSLPAPIEHNFVFEPLSVCKDILDQDILGGDEMTSCFQRQIELDNSQRKVPPLIIRPLMPRKSLKRSKKKPSENEKAGLKLTIRLSNRILKKLAKKEKNKRLKKINSLEKSLIDIQEEINSVRSVIDAKKVVSGSNQCENYSTRPGPKCAKKKFSIRSGSSTKAAESKPIPSLKHTKGLKPVVRLPKISMSELLAKAKVSKSNKKHIVLQPPKEVAGKSVAAKPEPILPSKIKRGPNFLADKKCPAVKSFDLSQAHQPSAQLPEAMNRTIGIEPTKAKSKCSDSSAPTKKPISKHQKLPSGHGRNLKPGPKSRTRLIGGKLKGLVQEVESEIILSNKSPSCSPPPHEFLSNRSRSPFTTDAAMRARRNSKREMWILGGVAPTRSPTPPKPHFVVLNPPCFARKSTVPTSPVSHFQPAVVVAGEEQEKSGAGGDDGVKVDGLKIQPLPETTPPVPPVGDLLNSTIQAIEHERNGNLPAANEVYSVIDSLFDDEIGSFKKVLDETVTFVEFADECTVPEMVDVRPEPRAEEIVRQILDQIVSRVISRIGASLPPTHTRKRRGGDVACCKEDTGFSKRPKRSLSNINVDQSLLPTSSIEAPVSDDVASTTLDRVSENAASSTQNLASSDNASMVVSLLDDVLKNVIILAKKDEQFDQLISNCVEKSLPSKEIIAPYNPPVDSEEEFGIGPTSSIPGRKYSDLKCLPYEFDYDANSDRDSTSSDLCNNETSQDELPSDEGSSTILRTSFPSSLKRGSSSSSSSRPPPTSAFCRQGYVKRRRKRKSPLQQALANSKRKRMEASVAAAARALISLDDTTSSNSLSSLDSPRAESGKENQHELLVVAAAMETVRAPPKELVPDMFVNDEFDNDQIPPEMNDPPAAAAAAASTSQLDLGRGKRKKCATLRMCPCACGGDRLLHEEGVQKKITVVPETERNRKTSSEEENSEEKVGEDVGKKTSEAIVRTTTSCDDDEVNDDDYKTDVVSVIKRRRRSSTISKNFKSDDSEETPEGKKEKGEKKDNKILLSGTGAADKKTPAALKNDKIPLKARKKILEATFEKSERMKAQKKRKKVVVLKAH